MRIKTVLCFFIPFFSVFTAHYVAANTYAIVCCPVSFLGIIQSVFMTGGPACGLILSIVNYTHGAYAAITAGMATVVIQKISQNII